MNIILMDWNSFGNEDIIENFEYLGHSVVRIPFRDDTKKDDEIQRIIEEKLIYFKADFVFSFNYYPEVSKCCNRINMKYVSWVYDNPHMQVYSYTVINECNYVFLFDYTMYSELKNAGINTVYYLPLAVNALRLERLDKLYANDSRFTHEVSFVGSMYSEKKHRLYDKFKGMSSYTKGYLDGLINAQKNVYGYNFLQELLSDEIISQMQEIYPTNPFGDMVMTPGALYADYVLARQVTALERFECLEKIGAMCDMDLYTYDKGVTIKGVTNHGPCDYYNDMPKIFRTSKINLNISLKSIKSGIPLRVLDIMGNGGFVITNYQEEMFNFFEPGVDFVYYTDEEDLISKIQYYLGNEEERLGIANNGCEKVRSNFSYLNKLKKMFAIIQGERN